jgi:hypothetical protein
VNAANRPAHGARVLPRPPFAAPPMQPFNAPPFNAPRELQEARHIRQEQARARCCMHQLPPF